MLHTRRFGILLLLAGLMLTATGCQVVHVATPDGKPIFWATVNTSVQNRGAGNFPAKTDLLGNATLPLSQEAPGTPEFIEVSKEGYMSARIRRTEDPTMEVTLRPSGARRNPSAPMAPSRPNAQTEK